jgi:hypothetical protein
MNCLEEKQRRKEEEEKVIVGRWANQFTSG